MLDRNHDGSITRAELMALAGGGSSGGMQAAGTGTMCASGGAAAATMMSSRGASGAAAQTITAADSSTAFGAGAQYLTHEQALAIDPNVDRAPQHVQTIASQTRTSQSMTGASMGTMSASGGAALGTMTGASGGAAGRADLFSMLDNNRDGSISRSEFMSAIHGGASGGMQAAGGAGGGNCQACGNVFAPDALFCRKCGAKRGA